MNNKSFVWAKLPRAGLGNKLIIWAEAYLFAKKHNLKLITTNWFSFFPGTFLRREKNKRLYFNEVKNPWIKNWLFIFTHCFYKKQKIDVNNKGDKIMPHSAYIFDKMPNYSTFFQDNIDEIHDVFDELINPNVKKTLSTCPLPFIAVHIRMGDFRKVYLEEEFSYTTGIRTPLNYYIQIINLIREELGFDAPVTIFSDGHRKELQDILNLDNVVINESKKDILDILLMSKSKILITAHGSSFSGWAAVLSRNIIIHHFKDHTKFVENDKRCENDLFEGCFEFSDGILRLPEKLKMDLKKL